MLSIDHQQRGNAQHERVTMNKTLVKTAKSCPEKWELIKGLESGDFIQVAEQVFSVESKYSTSDYSCTYYCLNLVDENYNVINKREKFLIKRPINKPAYLLCKNHLLDYKYVQIDNEGIINLSLCADAQKYACDLSGRPYHLDNALTTHDLIKLQK